MQVFTDAAWSHLDFAANSAKIVQPGNELRERHGCFDQLTPDEQKRLKDNLFSTLLTVNEVVVEPRNAILDEQHDFVISIRSNNQPSVSGEDGLKALAVAHQILGSIKTHGWNAAAQRETDAPIVIPLPFTAQTPDRRRAS
jgi:predicted dehydrogenase